MIATRRTTRPARARTSTKRLRRAASPARRSAESTARRAKSRVARKAAKPAARRAPRPAVSRVANGIGLVSHHTDYTSQALDEMRHFYTELLGFTSYELDPRRNYLIVRLSPSSSLGFTPPVEGPPEQWRPPREPALYLFVEDVDRAHADLVAKGVEFVRPPEDTIYGHRLAVLRDPEGRTVCLAHPLKR